MQPRQIFAFSRAPLLGWTGDARGAAVQGLEYFLGRYRRSDGLFRTLITAEGTPVDDQAILYDQAFALLAFATAASLAGSAFDLAAEGRKLREALFTSSETAGSWLQMIRPSTWAGAFVQSPHMHLLEAALAWQLDVGGGREWQGVGR